MRLKQPGTGTEFGFTTSKLLMLTFFAVFLLFPILRMMSAMTMETIVATVKTAAFRAALKLSLIHI